MIVVDLDDSLLGNDLKISKENKKALKSAMDKGLLVTIATGRMLSSALPYIRELNIDIPVITYQGAYIKDTLTGETLTKTTLPMMYAKQLIEECKKDDLYIQAYVEDNYYFAHDNEYSQLYHRLSGIKGIEVGDLETFLKEEPIKMLIIDVPYRISTFRNKFDALYGEHIQIAISKPNYLEITHIDATKGRALEHLALMLGIAREEVIAIGDSYNDISMLDYAGLGVAMGNAPDEVKAHAQYVTKGNDEDGVAEVVKMYVLKEEYEGE